MLTMDNPICEERFYFDDYKPAARQPMSEVDAERTWRRLSSSESFEDSNTWSPPVTSADDRFSVPKASQDVTANWMSKPMEQWTADEVTLWICSLMNQSQSPFDSGYCPAINVAAYLNLTGAELMQLSSTDIQTRDPQSGAFVFMSMQKYISQLNTPYSISSTVLPSYTHMENVRRDTNMPSHIRGNEHIKQEYNHIKQEPKDFAHPRLPSLDLKMISFDIDDHFDSIQSLAKDISVDQLVKNLHVLRGPEKQRLVPPSELAANPGFPHMPNAPPPVFNAHNLNMKAWGEQIQQLGSPMVSPRSDGSMSPPEELSKEFYGNNYQYNEVKGNHLWEFIRDLLFDSRYNPSFVKWEDREEGVFKFVKSDQVAKLWGKKKNNPAMTYEKLSRAMRYYYRRKILERIDGRRLVYKFGSMATGWKP